MCRNVIIVKHCILCFCLLKPVFITSEFCINDLYCVYQITEIFLSLLNIVSPATTPFFFFFCLFTITSLLYVKEFYCRCQITEKFFCHFYFPTMCHYHFFFLVKTCSYFIRFRCKRVELHVKLQKYSFIFVIVKHCILSFLFAKTWFL